MKWLSAPKFAPATSDDNRTGREILWLLIFDIVVDASLLRDYWPVGSEGYILVTTRDERAGNYHSGSLEHRFIQGLFDY